MELFLNGTQTNEAGIRLEHLTDPSITKLIEINAISGRIDVSN